MKILVIAAHPDDEILGCGATVAKLRSQGAEVCCAILAEGITSRASVPEPAGLLDELHATAHRVGAYIGFHKVELAGFPDNRMDTVPLLDVVHWVERLIERVEPDAIYTHRDGDLNIDHHVVHRAVLTATRPVTGNTVADLYAFEVPSSTEWAFGAAPFRPNIYIDVAATLEKKIRAMEMYRSEARPFPHPRSPEALRAIATRWGTVAGCEAAEAFELIRSIRK